MLDQVLERRAVQVDIDERLVRVAGAAIGLLVGDEIGAREEAVLQVVDAEVGRFAIGDGTEVTGDLELPRVRGGAPPAPGSGSLPVRRSSSSGYTTPE